MAGAAPGTTGGVDLAFGCVKALAIAALKSSLARAIVFNPFRGVRRTKAAYVRIGLRMHMAARESKATRQGCMGLQNFRWPGLKNLFAGPPGSKATRQGCRGLRRLRLAGLKSLFAAFRGHAHGYKAVPSRPQNLRMHIATRDSKATRQGFMGLRSLRLAGLKSLFAGSRLQNLHMHMATRDSQATRQAFMGLRSLRLAGFKTFSRAPGLKTFACTWLQGTLRPPGKVLWAFEACVWPASKPFRGLPASKPARAHGYMTLTPPGKVLWAFEACVWPASKPFSRGPGL